VGSCRSAPIETSNTCRRGFALILWLNVENRNLTRRAATFRQTCLIGECNGFLRCSVFGGLCLVVSVRGWGPVLIGEL
jgi:hypothetical protein